MKGMLYKKIFICTVASLIFPNLTYGCLYKSFEASVNKSFGSGNQKNVSIITQINIPTVGKIKDFDISLDLNHTSFCDLAISIQSPCGTSATISYYDQYTFIANKQCSGWLTVDNESDNVISQLGNVLTNSSFKPDGKKPISVFYSLSATGLWKITITDLRYGDTGALNRIRFDMIIDAPMATLSIPEPSTLIFSIAVLIKLFKTKY